MHDGHFQYYERGLDRIADLALLAGHVDAYGVKHVELFDEWEKFTVSFSIYEPRMHHWRDMRIAGDRGELGDWHEPIVMDTVRDRGWLRRQKYGQGVKKVYK